MFPATKISENTSTDTEEIDTGIDFVFDYTTGQHALKGLVKECSVIESVRQYISNVLRTPSDTYKVYTQDESDSFGISVFNYIGKKNVPIGYINSELKREVTEMLLRHPYITDVSNWTGERERKNLHVSFTVTLTDNSVINISEDITEMNYV
ncbi:MAG: DUF2634 domain-containing protein [Clostridiales bacterium]|nr:DUF2634 domain-containing protein [Clostridiales bacterium]